MAKCAFARWAPDGATPGGAIVPRVVILHCTAISGDAHPHAGLEWHFEIMKSGSIDQLVDTERRADANLKANAFAISVETQGLGGEPLTSAQMTSFLSICQWANDTHGVPLKRCEAWNGSGIGYHTMWGAPSEWTPVAKACPGPERIRQFNEIIIPTLALPPLLLGDDEMFIAWCPERNQNKLSDGVIRQDIDPATFSELQKTFKTVTISGKWYDQLIDIDALKK